MIISGGALAVYDYLLTFDDEVCQSYPLSTVQRYLKVTQRYLMSGREKKVGVGTPDPRYHGPSLTPHGASTSTLPVHCGMIFGL